MKVQTKIIHLLIIIFSALLILISAQKTSYVNSKKLGLVKRNSPSRSWRKSNVRSLQNRLQSRQVTISEGPTLSQSSPSATAAVKEPSLRKVRPSLPSSNKPPSPPPSVPKTPSPPPPPAPKSPPPPSPPAPKKAPPVFPSSPSSTAPVFQSPTTTSSSLPLQKTPKGTSSSAAIAESPSYIIRSTTTIFLLVQLVVLFYD